MRTKPASAPDRIGDFLESYTDLSENDREVVRSRLKDPTLIEPVPSAALEPGAYDKISKEADRLASDPALIAFTILAVIAGAATLVLLARW